MRLSIITINFNNAAGLQKTFNSVFNQSFRDIEYIVIDGGSQDGSRELIEAHNADIDYWVSEPDRGVYHAMNKGINASSADFLLFLNSGDELASVDVLYKLLKDTDGPKFDLIYGDSRRVYPDGKEVIFVCPDRVDLRFLMDTSLPHQSVLIKKSLFDKYGMYREDLRIVSDWAFFLNVFLFGNCNHVHINLVVSNFYMDGMSAKMAGLMREEREKVLADSLSTEMRQIVNNALSEGRLVKLARKISGKYQKFKAFN